MSRNAGLRPAPAPPTIHFGSRNSAAAAALGRIGISIPVSLATSPWSDAANKLIAFPFWLDVPTTIYKGFAVNGTSPGGNFEIGVLDASFNKLVSSGSVASGAGGSVPVMADVTDTKLPPGLYYAAMSHDATTASRYFGWTLATTGATFYQSFGCWQQAAAGPGSFPTTATPADVSNVSFPLFGLITRSVFDV